MLVQLVIPCGSLELERLVAHCENQVVLRFGGCTLSSLEWGSWIGPDNERVRELVRTLTVECGDRSENTVRAWFDNLAQFIRCDGNQHTVYYRMVRCTSRMVGPDTITGQGPQDDLSTTDPLLDEAVRHVDRVNEILSDWHNCEACNQPMPR